jgi:hypothetical protein
MDAESAHLAGARGCKASAIVHYAQGDGAGGPRALRRPPPRYIERRAVAGFPRVPLERRHQAQVIEHRGPQREGDAPNRAHRSFRRGGNARKPVRNRRTRPRPAMPCGRAVSVETAGRVRKPAPVPRRESIGIGLECGQVSVSLLGFTVERRAGIIGDVQHGFPALRQLPAEVGAHAGPLLLAGHPGLNGSVKRSWLVISMAAMIGVPLHPPQRRRLDAQRAVVDAGALAALRERRASRALDILSEFGLPPGARYGNVA